MTAKRRRRTNAELAELDEQIVEIVAENAPVTCRQAFYLAVAAGLIDKTEAGYKRIRIMLGTLRRGGRVPWGSVVDFTRTMRKPRSYDDLADALEHTAEFYRRSLWGRLPVRVEVWAEKDTLTGVLYSETATFDVPLMPTRGYPSLSFLYAAAEQIRAARKPTFIAYFGDHDPSGVDIPRKIEAGLREFAPGAEIHFERLAVLPDQIAAWNLTTRPTKQSDTRARTFSGESVEVEAIAPATLRRLCREAISQHIPDGALRTLQVAEQSERELIRNWAAIARG